MKRIAVLFMLIASLALLPACQSQIANQRANLEQTVQALNATLVTATATATPLPSAPPTNTSTPQPTKTRQPTQTRAPSPTPTRNLAATATAQFKEVAAHGMDLCIGRRIRDAAAYQPGSGPHPVLVCDEFNCNAINWAPMVDLPQGIDAAAWIPKTPEETQLVICTTIKKTQVGQCSYSDPSGKITYGVKLVRLKFTYVVMEASTARRIKTISFSGDAPTRDQCPRILDFNSPVGSGLINLAEGELDGGWPNMVEVFKTLNAFLEMPTP